jgi:3-oxoacyl-[acyl-carrier-protein] synthase-1
MPPLRRAYVVGFGAVTPVGASAAVAMAAVRAGVTRISLDPNAADLGDSDASNVARIGHLDVDEPGERGKALIQLAVEQAVASVPSGRIGSIRVWTAGPSSPDNTLVIAKVLADRLRLVPASVEHVGGHGSSALLAVERACAALRDGSVDWALIAGFDLRTDPESIAAGVRAGRVIGPERSWGHVPGEGAAALLLASERVVQRRENHTALVAVASANEPQPLGSNSPCLGKGLTEAATQALSALPPGTRAARVLCDLNGERHRADEWGFTVTRIGNHLRDPSAFESPATAWGDCGAANGLLLLGLAAAAGARGEGAGDCLLVWTSSDGPERAAALVQLPTLPAEKPVYAADHATVRPPWAKQLDRDIVVEMIDECNFRVRQRAYRLSTTTGDDPPPDFAPISRIEMILDALAVGLAECGALAHEQALSLVTVGAPETVYTAVRALLEDGRSSAAIELATRQILEAPATEEAVREAYLHTQRPRDPKDDRVVALRSADPVLQWLAVEVAAFSDAPIPAAWLAKLVPSVPAAREVAFLRALGRLGDPSLRPHLDRWLRSPDPTARQEAALADILLGGDDARRFLLSRAETDNALILPAALIVDSRRAPWLLSRAKATGDCDAVLAVAIAGDPTSVPWLLDQLANPSTAHTAAAALELLLGVPCFEDAKISDEDETAPLRKVRRVSCQRRLWEPIAARVLAGHPPTARLRAGVLASRLSAMALLDRPHLPSLARRYLGYELALRWGAPRSFDATAPIRVQRRWLATLQATKDVQRPGVWELALWG